MSFLTFVAAFALAGLIGIPLSVYAMRRSGARSAGFIIASALFLSFPFMGERGPALMEEAKDETGRKKDEAAGDPPVVG